MAETKIDIYKKAKKLHSLVNIQNLASHIQRDAKQLSTGNLSHHKVSIQSYSEQILKKAEELEPLLEEFKQILFDKANKL